MAILWLAACLGADHRPTPGQMSRNESLPPLSSRQAGRLVLDGCERRKRLIEIQTPGIEIPVDRIGREDGTGRFEVDVARDRRGSRQSYRADAYS